MTELYIDGTAAVLPKDFSIQVKRENPLFTKNGEYTYDITLPLNNATNAELYKHLNRLNSTQAVSTDRQAVLVADNRVYCNGTEIITGWTEDTVSVQIASGNSELNWIIGADLQISFLDGMPETPALTETQIIQTTKSSYPNVQFNLPPIYDRTNDTVINPYWADLTVSPSEYHPEKNDADQPLDFYPQPYLCAYIHALFDALGYELEYLFLENTEYKELLICHAVRSMCWKDYLPGWSVRDFLEQFELLFNATVLVDNRHRTARILNNTAYYAGQATVHVTGVVDEYEAERADADDEPEAVELMQCNVKYAFPSSAYWRGRDLPDSVQADARHQSIPTDYEPDTSVIGRFNAWFAQAEHQDRTYIYTDKQSGEKAYVAELTSDPFGQGEVHVCWEFADQFHRIERENADQDVELEMIPAEISRAGSYRYRTTLPNGGDGWGSMLLFPAVIDNAETAEDNTGEEIPVSELLENNSDSDAEDSSKNPIALAFYGLIDLYAFDPGYTDLVFPTAYTDLYTSSQGSWKIYNIPTNDTGLSLRLPKLQQDFWEGNHDINQEDAIKISSHDPNLYDARYIFEIRNKRYVCREMEFALDAHGRKGAWTGTFYPIKISDTDADARWILTDGKWRDGGVWLDNGRWLDE